MSPSQGKALRTRLVQLHTCVHARMLLHPDEQGRLSAQHLFSYALHLNGKPVPFGACTTTLLACRSVTQSLHWRRKRNQIEANVLGGLHILLHHFACIF